MCEHSVQSSQSDLNRSELNQHTFLINLGCILVLDTYFFSTSSRSQPKCNQEVKRDNMHARERNTTPLRSKAGKRTTANRYMRRAPDLLPSNRPEATPTCLRHPPSASTSEASRCKNVAQNKKRTLLRAAVASPWWTSSRATSQWRKQRPRWKAQRGRTPENNG